MRKFVALLLTFVMVFSYAGSITFTVGAESSEPTVLFSETFETTSTELPLPLATSKTEGYNSWVLEKENYQAAYDQGTKFEIIQETTDNKALYAQRDGYITSTSEYFEQMPVMRTLPSIPETDTVKVSWRMKNDEAKHYLSWRGHLTEIRQDRVTTASGHRFTPSTEQEALFTDTTSWHTYELIINYTMGTTTLKVDYQQIGDAENGTMAITKLDFFLPNNSANAVGNILIDDITITHIPDPEYLTFTEIANGQTIDNVTEDLNLITSKGDYTFEWASSNPAVITTDGTVIAPTGDNAYVTLTATVKAAGNPISTVSFIVTVPADTEGQTVLFEENFEGASEALPMALATSPTAGYNGWLLEKDNYADAKAQGTEFNIIAESETNKILNGIRTGYISGAEDSPGYVYYVQMIAEKELPSIPMKDTVKLSWRMKSEKTSHYLAMRGIFSELRADRITLATGHIFTPTTEQLPLLTNNTDWMTYELLLNYTANTATMKINGQQIGDVGDGTLELKSLELFMPNNYSSAVGNLYIDDIKITHIPDPVWVTFDEISNGQKIGNVTQNLNLITTKDIYTFEWSSSNTDIISNTGVVNQPSLKDDTVNLALTVKLTDGGSVVGTQNFTVTVPSSGDIIYEENFDSAEIGTHLVETTMSGYNGWVLDNRSAVGGSISPLEKAVTENTLLQVQTDPADASNKALHLRRDLHVSYDRSPYDGQDPTNWIAKYEINSETPINSGVVYLSGRIWFQSAGSRIWLEPFGAIRTDRWVTATTNNYFNSGAYYEYTNEEAALWKIQDWNTFGFLMNFDDHTTQMYVNGQPVGPEVFMTLTELDMLNIYMPRNEQGGKHYLDDLVIKKANLPDIDWVNMALEDIVLETPAEGVTEPLVLPETSTYGTTISWSSSNPDMIAVDGAVARPIGDNQTVILTATVSKNGVSNTKDFPVVVKGYSDVEYISATFGFNLIGNGQKEWYVTEDLSLIDSFDGSSITWESKNTDVLTHDGQVTRTSTDVPVVFSATFDFNGSTFTRDFNLVIAGEGKILVEEDFSATSTEGQDINGWNNWVQEEPTKIPSVSAIIRKDVSDTLKSYEDAEKVLTFKRYLTGAEGEVCNHMIMKKFSAIKPEIMRIDFDFRFKNPNTTMYIELEGMNRHYGISQTGIGLKGYTAVPFDEELETNKWYHATIELDTYTNEYNMYLDYEKLNEEPIFFPGSAKITSLNFYSNFTTATTHEEFMVRRIMIRDTAPSHADAVANAKAALTLGEIDYTICKLELPLYGEDNTRVTWSSSNPAIISNDGVVTRQTSQKVVTLTATITKGNVSDTKDIPVAVFSSSRSETPTTEILDAIASQLTEETITDEPRFRLTKNLDLPTEITKGRAADIGGVDITWESNYPSVVSAEGVITPQQYEVAATLTATLSAKADPNVTTQKDLKFAVEIESEVFHDFPFDNMPVDMAGENITEWSGIYMRDRQGGTEYGTQLFADKEPADRYLAYEDANEVFYLNRYTTAKYDPITDMSHATIRKFDEHDYYYGDVITLSYRMKFTANSEQIKNGIFCQKEKSIRVNPLTLSVSGNTYEHTFEEPLALNEWHDFTFYYDMDTWRLDIYVNGDYILSEPIVIGEGPYPYLNQWRFFNDSLNYIFIDDVRVRNISLPDASGIVTNAMAITEIPKTLDKDIKLPSYMGSCAITWRSSDESVVSHGGVINPSSTQSKSATLTATFRYDDVVKTKKFNINVPAQTAYADKYEITDISVSADTVSSVKLSRKNNGSSTDKLMIAVYDQEEFVNLYLYDIADGNVGDTVTVSTDISIADTINYKIKAFVINSDNNNEKISNVYICKEENAE